MMLSKPFAAAMAAILSTWLCGCASDKGAVTAQDPATLPEDQNREATRAGVQRAFDGARELAADHKYDEATKALADAQKQYGGTRTGYAALEGVEETKARYARLKAAWSAVSDAAGARAYLRELLNGAATEEETVEALQVVVRHDAKVQAFMKDAFPMKLDARWSSSAEDAARKVFAETVATRSAELGVPVAVDGAGWTLMQDIGSEDHEVQGVGAMRVFGGTCTWLGREGNVRHTEPVGVARPGIVSDEPEQARALGNTLASALFARVVAWIASDQI